MVWEFPDDEWCDCSESESTVFMGAQVINSPKNPQQYQLAPEIKSLDPAKTPSGGIDLQPFTPQSSQNERVNAAMQNVAALQKANVDAYNQNIRQQQQKIIDSENQKIRSQNQATIASYEKGQAKYKNSPNSQQMPASRRFQTAAPIDYSQYTPRSPQPQPQPIGKAKYKASAPANPFNSDIFKNPTVKM
jgi:hypothetical protein